MKNNILIFVIPILVSIISCDNSNEKKGNNQINSNITEINQNSNKKEELSFYELSNKIETYYAEESSIDSNTVMNLIYEDCAIFKSPDSLEIKELKKEYGEQDFYIVSDDNLYYMHEARKFLDSVGVKSINVSNSGYYKLIDKNNKSIILDLKAKNSKAWNLLFFSRKKGIKIVDILEIDTEFRTFFLTK